MTAVKISAGSQPEDALAAVAAGADAPGLYLRALAAGDHPGSGRGGI